MPSVTLKLDVDDAEMKAAIERLERRGFENAMKRAVLASARLARAILIVATRAAMHNEPGGYNPYSAANFKRPKTTKRYGGISAGAGYTSAGYIVRFRSTGTKPRFTKKGAYRGIELGLGMSQQAASVADPQFPRLANLELQAELDAEGLG